VYCTDPGGKTAITFDSVSREITTEQFPFDAIEPWLLQVSNTEFSPGCAIIEVGGIGRLLPPTSIVVASA
jgi:hypothetical protein